MVLEREKLYERSVEDMQSDMEQNVVVFTDEINTVDSPEELKKREEELMEEFKKDDEYIKELMLELPKDTEYDGTKYKRQEMTRAIISFISRLEVEFRATLGIYQAIQFWKSCEEPKIPYAVYDTTLRLLGMVKYRGEKDCGDILAINNWFSSAHEDYLRTNTYTGYLSTIHQAILKRMSELEGDKEEEGKEEE